MTKPSWQDFATHDESAYPELWDGVIGAWAPCLGPTGSRLHDHGRRSNWGTLTNMDNATDWVVDGGQYALDFDGSNDYVATMGNIDISGAQPRTMAGWINLKSLANAAIFGYGEPVSSGWFYLLVINGGWYVSGFNNDFDTSVAAQTGLRHVALTYDGATVAVVVDGVTVGTAAKTYNTTAAPLNIARRTFTPAPLHAAVAIFDLAIWRRSLSKSEIRQLYQLGCGGMYQRRRRSRLYIPQAGFQAAWARGSNVLLGFNQP